MVIACGSACPSYAALLVGVSLASSEALTAALEGGFEEALARGRGRLAAEAAVLYLAKPSLLIAMAGALLYLAGLSASLLGAPGAGLVGLVYASSLALLLVSRGLAARYLALLGLLRPLYASVVTAPLLAAGLSALGAGSIACLASSYLASALLVAAHPATLGGARRLGGVRPRWAPRLGPVALASASKYVVAGVLALSLGYPPLTAALLFDGLNRLRVVAEALVGRPARLLPLLTLAPYTHTAATLAFAAALALVGVLGQGSQSPLRAVLSC